MILCIICSAVGFHARYRVHVTLAFAACNTKEHGEVTHEVQQTPEEFEMRELKKKSELLCSTSELFSRVDTF